MDTSRELKAWIAKNKAPIGKSMKSVQIEEAIGLLLATPREGVNAAVYNQLLALIGREGRMERMWRLFNDVSGVTLACPLHI